ncbi:MAG: threonine-phosphate decarboxylase [Firmicutes bacterium]|nr:threonine-phosphate decarboxylase [Bacillota bacterium]
MEAAVQKHGGNIVEAASRYQRDARSFIDFSANINPLGVPVSVKRVIIENLDLLVHYPDPGCRALKEALSGSIGVPVESIIVGNGGSELIYLLARVIKPKKALILHPTFSEYGDAVLAAGGEVESLLASPGTGFYHDLSAMPRLPQMEGVEMIFLCNPNNPTGRTWTREEVLGLAGWSAARGIWLVVDEAFMDFVDDWAEREVIAAASSRSRLIVTRSMTKFFALAGLRLGYAVASRDTVERLEASREPWSVNWLAQVAGVAALADKDYQARTREWIEEERRYMARELSAIAGLESWPTETNYMLLRIKRENRYTRDLQAVLGPRGLLIRDGSSFPGLGPDYFRVAIRSRPENQRLLDELRRALAQL